MQRSNFKSNVEYQLALFFERENIRYQYEFPLVLYDDGKLELWHPDFRLRDYGLFVEYFGGINNNSIKINQSKRRIYHNNGIDVICLTLDFFKGDWPQKLLHQIKSELQNRVRRFNIYTGH